MRDSTTPGDLLAAILDLHALLDARLPSPAVAEQPTTPDLPPGWVRHDGGQNPVPGGEVAGLMLRGGAQPMMRVSTDKLRWRHYDGDDSDIIAYLPVAERQAGPHAEAVQALAEVLDCLSEAGDPKHPYQRTGWIPVERVDRWRAVLDRAQGDG